MRRNEDPARDLSKRLVDVMRGSEMPTAGAAVMLVMGYMLITTMEQRGRAAADTILDETIRWLRKELDKAEADQRGRLN